MNAITSPKGFLFTFELITVNFGRISCSLASSYQEPEYMNLHNILLHK